MKQLVQERDLAPHLFLGCFLVRSIRCLAAAVHMLSVIMKPSDSPMSTNDTPGDLTEGLEESLDFVRFCPVFSEGVLILHGNDFCLSMHFFW